MIPRETAWLPSLVFLGFIVPARILTGWAYARSGRRDQPRHGFFRWTSRLVILDRPGLRPHRLLHPIHGLARDLEPVRAARVPAPGSVSEHVKRSKF